MSLEKGRKNIIYLGFAISEELQRKVDQVDSLPHYATNNFSWSFIRALKCGFDDVDIISSAEIRNFPAGKKVLFYTKRFSKDGFKGLFIGFINVIILKHLSRFANIFTHANNFLRNQNNGILILHGTHTPFMMYAIWLKFYRNYRIAIVLTDEHGLYVSSDGFIGVLLRRIDVYLMSLFIRKFDYYVCLSNSFVEKYNLKKALVIPGILNSRLPLKDKSLDDFNDEKFVILFAGGLNKQNGVDMLLEAGFLLKSKEILLCFLGRGELLSDILKAEQKNPQIKYLGVKVGDELAEDFFKADLLINPRPNDKEYTKTSFPSKLIEYMATGIPSLTTRLAGIPDEIEDCFFYIDDVNPSGIADSIDELYKVDIRTRVQVGQRAKERVKSFYSEEAVGEKIYYFLNN